MIPTGRRVIFSPPAIGGHAPVGLHGVVLGVAQWAFAPLWPGAVIYRVAMTDGYEHYVIGEMLTGVEGDPATYSVESGRA